MVFKKRNNRDYLTRRQFLAGEAAVLSGAVVARSTHSTDISVAEGQTAGLMQKSYLPMISQSADLPPSGPYHIYVARNGTPVTNVQNVIALAGGIQRFIDYDDAVVLKPNGQWPNQGYTHTLCIKALIDLIINRPGGFGGEIIIAEHVHRDPTAALTGSYCWNMSAGNRLRNWPDMNYFELIQYYHSWGILNVAAIPLYDSGSGDFSAVSGPAALSSGRHGWVRASYTAASNGRKVRLSHPVLYSGFSGKWIDLKNGVWENGAYNGQKVKLIVLPTLNNHGSLDAEDYAGPTSAIKSHLGIVDFTGDSNTPYTLHSVGFNAPVRPEALGESVGYLITRILSPAFYMTCAEYTGYGGRTGSTATQTKTVGLCTDPATLDYWMCKHVMFPCRTNQVFMNPDNDYNLRKTLVGCRSMGLGTLNEAEITAHQITLP